MNLDRFFIEFVRFALNDLQGALGAFTNAGPQSIAKVIGNRFGLTVHNGQSPLSTADHTLAAAVTFFFINLNDFAFYLHEITVPGVAGSFKFEVLSFKFGG
jgi:hypothetical protein